MSRAAGIIGRALQGAADVAVPAALDNQRARIQEMRDARLHKYSMESQKSQQDFAASQADKQIAANAANQQAQRDFTSSENEKSRTATSNLQQQQQQFTKEQNELNRANQVAIANLSQPEREARVRLLEEQIGDAQLSTKVKQLQVSKAEESQRLLQEMNDPNLTPEQKSAMLDLYYTLNPDARRKVIVKQLRDKFGMPTDEFAIFDQSTGERLDRQSSGQAAGSSGPSGGRNNAGERFRVGNVYTDGAGIKARYLGNDEWEQLNAP